MARWRVILALLAGLTVTFYVFSMEELSGTFCGRAGTSAPYRHAVSQVAAGPGASETLDSDRGHRGDVLANRSTATEPVRESTYRQGDVLPIVTYPDQGRVRFLLKHLTKAGGTVVRFIAESVLAENHFGYRGDDSEFHRYLFPKNFVVMVMRNPCDLYVSFANFHVRKAFGYGPNTGPCPWKELPNRTEEPEAHLAAFEQWLYNIRRVDGTGFYSFYIWQEFIDPTCHGGWNLNESERQRCLYNATQMRQELRAFNPLNYANCWVFHETMWEDLRFCLRAYELTSSYGTNAVNWSLFDRFEKDQPFLEATFSGSHLRSKNKAMSSQSLRHWSCDRYFKSARLRAFVQDTDFDLFEKFGYSGCCVSSNHRIR